MAINNSAPVQQSPGVGATQAGAAQPAELAELSATYGEWAAKLTAQEKAAFVAYRTPGVYYILNYFLRHGKLPEQKPWQHFDEEGLRNLAHLLSSAIEKAPALKKPMVVYRSMVLPDRMQAMRGKLRGQWMEERGFLSSTADMGVLKNFEQKRLTKPDKNHEPVCIKIVIPAGTKVAYIEPVLNSSFTEHEVLFPLGKPKGHSLQFTSDVQNVDGLPTVDARFAPNAARANWYPAFSAGWKPNSGGFDLDSYFTK